MDHFLGGTHELLDVVLVVRVAVQEHLLLLLLLVQAHIDLVAARLGLLHLFHNELGEVVVQVLCFLQVLAHGLNGVVELVHLVNP